MPQRERHRSGWLGPLALSLAVASWVVPILGSVIAAVAVVCGVVSLCHSRAARQRADWMTVAGAWIGSTHLFVSALLLLNDATGG